MPNGMVAPNGFPDSVRVSLSLLFPISQQQSNIHTNLAALWLLLNSMASVHFRLEAPFPRGCKRARVWADRMLTSVGQKV